MTKPLRGLYAITDPQLIPDEQLNHAVEQAILGGARLIQYRDKSDDPDRRLQQAQAIHAICSRHDVPLIINDAVELAAQVGAAGVHLGEEDSSLADARRLLGQQAIIGVSCYNRLYLALEAAQAKADYVAFGAFFPSPTKSTDIRATVELLRTARSAVNIPVVAIGGITPDNARPLIEAGADLLAVISGVFAQPDIQTAARQYARLFA